MAFGFYANSSLTVPQSGPIVCTVNEDGTTGHVDKQTWLGDADANWKFQAESGLGTHQITVSIADSDPGNWHEVGIVTLALSPAALDVNTPGDPLNCGTTIFGGVGNAISIYIRVDPTVFTVGTRLELSLVTNDVRVVAV
jgi:hypothetical protein